MLKKISVSIDQRHRALIPKMSEVHSILWALRMLGGHVMALDIKTYLLIYKQQICRNQKKL